MTEPKAQYHTTYDKTCPGCIHFSVCRIRHNVVIAGISLAADQPNDLIEQVQMNIATNCKYYEPIK